MHSPQTSHTGPLFSKKDKLTVVCAVSLGNLLEWYEIYLYIYWAPILAKLFFPSDCDLVGLTYTYLIFGLGFLARPLGGLFFGRLGDKIGRKKSLILSIIMMIIPTFITGLLPTYHQIGHLAPCILILMRLLQAFPAGGELPGAFCYLYESCEFKTRRFLSSFGALGYQLGVLISTVECFLLESFLSQSALADWGWRLSFLIGGLIGLFGLYLRYHLHETPLYREMQSHVQVVKESIFKTLYHYRNGIILGCLFCALNSAAFYLLSVNFSISFIEILGTSYKNALLMTSILLIFITLPLPLFGMLADRWNNKKMLIYSTLGMMASLLPLQAAIIQQSLVWTLIIMILFCLFFTCLSALIPFILCDIFPIYARFTCVGVSFNLVDTLIGGFAPVIALGLLNWTGQQTSFCYFLLFCGILSLIGYVIMKPPRLHHPHSSNSHKS